MGLYTAETKEAFEVKRTDLLEKLARVGEQVEGPFFADDQFHLVDGVWGTVFRYISVFEILDDFDYYQGDEKLRTWHNKTLARQSVIDAAPADYADQLLAFTKKKDGYLASFIKEPQAA